MEIVAQPLNAADTWALKIKQYSFVLVRIKMQFETDRHSHFYSIYEQWNRELEGLIESFLLLLVLMIRREVRSWVCTVHCAL